MRITLCNDVGLSFLFIKNSCVGEIEQINVLITQRLIIQYKQLNVITDNVTYRLV